MPFQAPDEIEGFALTQCQPYQEPRFSVRPFHGTLESLIHFHTVSAEHHQRRARLIREGIGDHLTGLEKELRRRDIKDAEMWAEYHLEQIEKIEGDLQEAA